MLSFSKVGSYVLLGDSVNVMEKGIIDPTKLIRTVLSGSGEKAHGIGGMVMEGYVLLSRIVLHHY